MLTPNAKVWKVLKKVKKNWFRELKRASSHYYENARSWDEKWTHNHWHDRLEMYLLYYQVDNAQVTNRLLYLNHVMQGGMAE